MKPRFDFKNLGIGIGLRTVHFAKILGENPPVEWFEILSENFMDTGGRPMFILDQIAEKYPIAMHGVSLNVGSTDRPDKSYLRKLKELAKRSNAHWVSDHLCWTGIAGRNMHDLLPMPYNEESLAHTIEHAREVSEYLERPLVLENPSSYVEFVGTTMPEWEFLARLAVEADCGLLLDVNNVYVSSFNHGFDPETYIKAIPHDRVVQYHLAGHTNYGTHIIDTHNDHVIDRVWELYALSHSISGGRSTLVEWDEDIPTFEVVHAEAEKARKHQKSPKSEKGKNRVAAR